jgi:phage terminase small subunit
MVVASITTTTAYGPRHLSKSSRAFWRAVAARYELDEHHVVILTLLCEAIDRCEEARAALAANGTTFIDRFNQPRARPEVAIERDSRIAVARLTRELGLDVEPTTPREPGRSW